MALVVTASSDAALHPMLTSAHLFSMVVGLKAPGVDVRKDVSFLPSILLRSGVTKGAHRFLRALSKAGKRGLVEMLTVKLM